MERTVDILEVKIVRHEDGTHRAHAPAVGYWNDAPTSGTLVGPGSAIGWLRQLGRRVRLQLPPGVAGRVQRTSRRVAQALAYGEPMFELLEIGGGAIAELTAESGAEAGAGAVQGMLAPTDGVFYSRPAPGAKPFVEVGQAIRRGQPIGLIEVMKTFNQITYGGPGLPESGTVREIRVSDGEEISAGQLLLVVD